MNLQYVKYALEISRTGSISKAAENLSVAQPNLSRAVKELESSLGIAIFDRTRTGMTVTPEGERLLAAGERILREVADMETMFDGEAAVRHSLSVCACPAAYISHAFVSFCAALPAEELFELRFSEGSMAEVLEAVTKGTAKLGVIRIPAHFEAYYTEKLAERELKHEVVAEYTPVALAGLGSPLAGREAVTPASLEGLCQVISPDSLPLNSDGTVKVDAPARLEIRVSDRATAYALLADDPTLYLCAPPIPPHVATKQGLIRRPMSGCGVFRDLLIYPRSYRLTDTDEAFLRALKGTARSLEG